NALFGATKNIFGATKNIFGATKNIFGATKRAFVAPKMYFGATKMPLGGFQRIIIIFPNFTEIFYKMNENKNRNKKIFYSIYGNKKSIYGNKKNNNKNLFD
ncbi:MAG: hypothetical protein LBD80_04830, partial [Tannerella sp.]|nr:hypothetical protein [Tannerella sp.]